MLNTRMPLIDEMVRTGFHALSGGQRLRYAQFEPAGAPRGTIVIAPGRREFIEKKSAELGREFLDRGYRLIFFEWRGQGMSDRFLGGEFHQRDHILDFATHMDDLHSFFVGVIKPNIVGPLILCGHSMGGHLLLRWLMENPKLPVRGLLLTSPMMALAGHAAHGTAGLITWGLMKLGHAEDYAPLQADYGPSEKLFENNPLTHDPERFMIMEKYFAAHPGMMVGGITWGWLHAALKSMHLVQRKHSLEHMMVPTMVIAATKDRVTPQAETARYVPHMPHAELVVIENGLHDIMNEADEYRNQAWAHIDRFLAAL